MDLSDFLPEWIKDPSGALWGVLGAFVDGAKEKAVDALTPYLDSLVSLMTSPFTFDWVANLTTFFQAVAIGIIFLIVIAKGITSGILIYGGSEDESVGHYLYRSFVPIALVAATPTIVGAVTTFTTDLLNLLVRGGTSAGIATTLVDCVFEWMAGAAVGAASALTMLPALIMAIAVIYYLVTICFQCIKRWVQLAVLSVITPLVCIFTATEDSSDYVTILKSMASMGVITALQVILLNSLSGIAETSALGMDGVMSAFMTVGCLAAIKMVPGWIEKYTGAASVAGRGGGGVRAVMYPATQVARIVGK